MVRADGMEKIMSKIGNAPQYGELAKRQNSGLPLPRSIC
jgi:hypothetical protein